MIFDRNILMFKLTIILIIKTINGGENWKRITKKEGMPKGDLGRIGLAIAPSMPNIVYALVEAKENGLYKSTDGGENWSLVSKKNIGNRPFYYSEIYVDPQNENRIYNLWSYVSKSEDGGKTFKTIMDYGNAVHPDHHAFWILRIIDLGRSFFITNTSCFFNHRNSDGVDHSIYVNSTFSKKIQTAMVADVVLDVLKIKFGEATKKMRVRRVKAGSVTVTCESSVLAEEIRLYEPDLITEINNRLNKFW